MKLQFLLIITLFGLFGQTYACKCNGLPTKEEGLKSSDLVIYGKVISTRLISFAKTIDSNKISAFKEKLKGDKKKLGLFERDWIQEVEILVKEKIKGEIKKDTVTIFTSWSSASCGYRFKMDVLYHVYAKRQSYLNVFFLNHKDRNKEFGRKNSFWTNQCTLTSEYHAK